MAKYRREETRITVNLYVIKVIKAAQVPKLSDQLESYSGRSTTGLIISSQGQNNSRVSKRLDAEKQHFVRGNCKEMVSNSNSTLYQFHSNKHVLYFQLKAFKLISH